MSNDYYQFENEFIPGTLAKAEELNEAFLAVEVAFDEAGVDIGRAIKLPEGFNSDLAEVTVGQRRFKVIGFNGLGELSLRGAFVYLGDWVTGFSYSENSIYRDPLTKNLYVVLIDHISTSIADDLIALKVALAINVFDVEQQRILAEAAADVAIANKLQTELDRVQTGLDRVQTGQDRIATAADRLFIEWAVDQFDDRYLGAKAVEPSLDNDGNPLQPGAIYLNTVTGFLRIYGPTGWFTFNIADEAIRAEFAAESARLSELMAATSENNALAYANAALAAAKTYSTIAQGLAATINGQYFLVATAQVQTFDVYQNNAGAALLKGQIDFGTAGKFYADGIDAFTVTDQLGFMLFYVEQDYFLFDNNFSDLKSVLTSLSGAANAVQVNDDGVSAVYVSDQLGFYVFEVSDLGVFFSAGYNDLESEIQFIKNELSGNNAESRVVLSQNTANLANLETINTTPQTHVTVPFYGYSLYMGYGQSNALGQESWPRLSKTQPFDNLMIGDSLRGNDMLVSANFVPTNGATLKPLIATVQNRANGTLIDDATIAATPEPNGNFAGETQIEGALNFSRREFLNRMALASDTSRRFVGSVTAVSGQSIAALSNGQPIFNKFKAASSVLKGIADGEARTSGIAATLYNQGEQDYSVSTPFETYKNALVQLADDIQSQVAQTIFAQGNLRRVPFLFAQTRVPGGLTRDDLVISRAQNEVGKEQNSKGMYLVGPNYPVPDKGIHLDPNGQRWLAQQFGKVYSRIISGKGWLHMHIKSVQKTGPRTLIVSCHVPCPPIQFKPVYTSTSGALVAQNFADRGFSLLQNYVEATDVGTYVQILGVEVVAPTVLKITTATDIDTDGVVILRYADFGGSPLQHTGNGNVCDSDPTIADSVYEYSAGTGQTLDKSIVELDGKPYPLCNFLVADQLTVQL